MIDPATGLPIDPLTQAPQGQPMQQQPQSQLGQFLGSPGMAMANQAIGNMSAMRRGQAPQSPTQAYQQAVGFNANLRMRKEQMEQVERQREHQRQMSTNIDQRAQSKEERDANPMFEYEQFKAKYPEQAKDITFPEFMRLGFRGTAQPAAVREYEKIHGPITGPLNDDQLADYLDIKRGGMGYGLPGGGEAYRGAGGRTEQLVSTEEAIAGDSLAAGEKRGAEKGADYKAKQLDTATDNLYGYQTQVELADEMNRRSQEWLDKIDSGEVEPGIINQFIYDTFKVAPAELAAMDTDAMKATLANLQIVNLAPVTVTELQKIAKLWADIGASPEANKGILRSVIASTKRLQRKLREGARRERSKVKEYGGEDEYDFLTGELPDLFPNRTPLDPLDGGPVPTGSQMRTFDYDENGNLVEVK